MISTAVLPSELVNSPGTSTARRINGARGPAIIRINGVINSPIVFFFLPLGTAEGDAKNLRRTSKALFAPFSIGMDKLKHKE